MDAWNLHSNRWSDVQPSHEAVPRRAPLIHLNTTTSLQGCSMKSPARNASYIGLLPWWPTSCQGLSTKMLHVPLQVKCNIAFKLHLRKKTIGALSLNLRVLTAMVGEPCSYIWTHKPIKKGSWFFPSCLGVYQATTKLFSWTVFLLFLWFHSLILSPHGVNIRLWVIRSCVNSSKSVSSQLKLPRVSPCRSSDCLWSAITSALYADKRVHHQDEWAHTTWECVKCVLSVTTAVLTAVHLWSDHSGSVFISGLNNLILTDAPL